MEALFDFGFLWRREVKYSRRQIKAREKVAVNLYLLFSPEWQDLSCRCSNTSCIFASHSMQVIIPGNSKPLTNNFFLSFHRRVSKTLETCRKKKCIGEEGCSTKFNSTCFFFSGIQGENWGKQHIRPAGFLHISSSSLFMDFNLKFTQGNWVFALSLLSDYHLGMQSACSRRFITKDETHQPVLYMSRIHLAWAR